MHNNKQAMEIKNRIGALEADCLGGDHVAERAALGAGEHASVDGLGKLLLVLPRILRKK